MKTRLLLAVLMIICSSIISTAKTIYLFEKKDVSVYSSIIGYSKKHNLHQKNNNEILTSLAINFIGTKYTELSKLSETDDEQVFIKLTNMDCVTFVENTIAFAAQIKNNEVDFNKFCRIIEKIRYRDGVALQFDSRFHYYSEWLKYYEKKNMIQFVTNENNAKIFAKKIYAISSKRNKYEALNNEDIYEKMIKIEKNISKNKFYFIPKKNLKSKERSIVKNGDIIAITSAVNGEDISHVGIAYFKNNRLYLIHASSYNKKVMMTPKPLMEYMLTKPKQSGIIVARLSDLSVLTE